MYVILSKICQRGPKHKSQTQVTSAVLCSRVAKHSQNYIWTKNWHTPQ